MARALGIDFGEARIGVAIADDLGLLAHPLETIEVRPGKDPVDRIVTLTEERDVDIIVLGLPVTMAGDEGTSAQKVREFGKRLREALPSDIDLEYVDERLSTVDAASKLRSAGHKAKAQKSIIDKAAAAVILQDFLDSHQQSDHDDSLAYFNWDDDDAISWSEDDEEDDAY